MTNFSSFSQSESDVRGELVLTSPEIRTAFDWTELVVSWNAQTPPGSGLKVEARALYRERTTKFYELGFWSEDGTHSPRGSVRGQKDATAHVATDTLVLREAVGRLQLRITLRGSTNGAQPRLRFLGLSFLRAGTPQAAGSSTPAAANATVLPVPERSQRSYPGGRDWCSPTCVSMVLTYWSSLLHRPELQVDVPQVAEGVHDPQWPGTGNWPFNTAFAGKFPGMRAYVTRLAGLSDLEEFIAAGVPPILSVSFDLLHGKLTDQGSGHLVVCVGFTETGDVVVNDPWTLLSAGESVRRIVPRQRVLNAWARSHCTVYLIHPETWPLPRASHRRW